jgi:hypothetical protein
MVRYGATLVSISRRARTSGTWDGAQANAFDLPAHDFWLFDDARPALLYFTGDDRPLGAQLMTHEAVVRQHAEWLATAVSHATPSPTSSTTA